MIATLFRWLGYGCDRQGYDCVNPVESLGWAPRLMLASAAALVLDATASSLSLNGWTYGAALFWACFALITLPVVLRIAWPNVSRRERIWLLNILGASLFMTRILESPTHFYGHDEYLHWSTTIDILERHHLFTANSLLPVSPYYPGLEIVTSALAQLTDLGVFPCAVILVGVLRMLCVSVIFLIFEKISASSWVGALATLVYMASSNFYTFLAAFSYETLALDLVFVAIFIAVLIGRGAVRDRWRMVWICGLILCAAAVSHHLSSYFGLITLSAAAAATFFRGDRKGAGATTAIAGVAVVSAGLWKWLTGGAANPYLGKILGGSVATFYGLLAGLSGGRSFFVSATGAVQPAAYRAMAILSVILISAGLVVGFFRSLGLRGDRGAAPEKPFLGMRDNVWAIVLTIMSFGFPVSVALRLTGGSWELGNRMSAFVFLGVGLVVAMGAAKVLITPRARPLRAAAFGLCLAIMIVGGVIAELPPDLVAGPYRPAADGSSVEPMGISTAQWTRDELGEGWRFASDRANKLLLATYGVQRVVTPQEDGVELGSVLFDQALFDMNTRSRRLADFDKNLIREGDPDFLLVDLRLQHDLPLWGFYFEAGEDSELHKSPPLAVDLQKFDELPRVGRIYDNSFEVIYDVRNLLEPERLNSPPPLAEKVDSAAWVGRTFRGGHPVVYDANAPGPAPQVGGAATLTKTTRLDRRATAQGKPSERPLIDYDAGVLRNVVK